MPTRLPEVVPVTDLRSRQAEIIKLLNKGPVILAQRSRSTAVLVSVAEWDALQEQVFAQAQEITELKAQLRQALLDKRSLEMRYVPGMAISWSEAIQQLNEPDAVHA